MRLFNWLRGTSRQRLQTKSEAIIRRVVKSFKLHTLEIEPGLWSVTAERRDTYQVSVFMWAEDAKICCMASCEISIERDLIARELALILLEDNHRFGDGSFRLVPREDNRIVVLGCHIDTLIFPESRIPNLCESLIERMQRMVTKLYGMGLIISGPELREKQCKRR